MKVSVLNLLKTQLLKGKAQAVEQNSSLTTEFKVLLEVVDKSSPLSSRNEDKRESNLPPGSTPAVSFSERHRNAHAVSHDNPKLDSKFEVARKKDDKTNQGESERGSMMSTTFAGLVKEFILSKPVPETLSVSIEKSVHTESDRVIASKEVLSPQKSASLVASNVVLQVPAQEIRNRSVDRVGTSPYTAGEVAKSVTRAPEMKEREQFLKQPVTQKRGENGVSAQLPQSSAPNRTVIEQLKPDLRSNISEQETQPPKHKSVLKYAKTSLKPIANNDVTPIPQRSFNTGIEFLTHHRSALFTKNSSIPHSVRNEVRSEKVNAQPAGRQQISLHSHSLPASMGVVPQIVERSLSQIPIATLSKGLETETNLSTKKSVESTNSQFNQQSALPVRSLLATLVTTVVSKLPSALVQVDSAKTPISKSLKEVNNDHVPKSDLKSNANIAHYSTLISTALELRQMTGQESKLIESTGKPSVMHVESPSVGAPIKSATGGAVRNKASNLTPEYLAIKPAQASTFQMPFEMATAQPLINIHPPMMHEIRSSSINNDRERNSDERTQATAMKREQDHPALVSDSVQTHSEKSTLQKNQPHNQERESGQVGTTNKSESNQSVMQQLPIQRPHSTASNVTSEALRAALQLALEQSRKRIVEPDELRMSVPFGELGTMDIDIIKDAGKFSIHIRAEPQAIAMMEEQRLQLVHWLRELGYPVEQLNITERNFNQKMADFANTEHTLRERESDKPRPARDWQVEDGMLFDEHNLVVARPSHSGSNVWTA